MATLEAFMTEFGKKRPLLAAPAPNMAASCTKSTLKHKNLYFCKDGVSDLEVPEKDVDEAWGCVDDLLTAAIKKIDGNDYKADPAYEKWFGEKSFFSKTSYLLRQKFVLHHLKRIQESLEEDWYICKTVTSADVASWSGPSRTIRIGKGGTGYFLAGVIIHEMGHQLGLPDICIEKGCHLDYFDEKKPTVDVSAKEKTLYNLRQCASNNTHGALAAKSKGHFIGSARCLELVQQSKNVSVINTDQHRWFCYQVSKAAVLKDAPAAVKDKAKKALGD